MLLLGLVYPLLMTAIAQMAFPHQANGSLVRSHGRVVGSVLLGQRFAGPGYFHPRPSAAGKGYDAAASGGSNLGPTSRSLAEAVRERVRVERRQNPVLRKRPVPVDMVTASGSGLDPDISLANAYAQVPRIALARGLPVGRVRTLVRADTAERAFGILGEPRVNVLKINMALDAVSGTGR